MQSASTPVIAEQGQDGSHLVPFPDPRWAFWRCVGVRGTGFPVTAIECLSSLNATASADSILLLEARRTEIRSAAIQKLERRLQLELTGESDKQKLELARRRLQRGKEASPTGLGGDIDHCIERFRQISSELTAAQVLFQQHYKLDAESFSFAIRQVARDPRFLEAILWQNRHALETAIRPLLAKNVMRRTRQRQYEEMLVNYLQRYCAKNDTIGFFGPMGWARLVDEGPAIVAVPGADLLGSREVYFEQWAIEIIAQTIESWAGAKRWLAPRRDPCISISGDKLHLADGKILRLAADAALVLAHCDGARTAEEISDDLIFEFMELFSSQDQVFSILEDLEKDRIIGWGIHLPGGPQAFAALQRVVADFGEDSLRRKAEAILDQLESKRQIVKAAAGDPAKLEGALAGLDAAFTKITGARSSHGAGLTYAGRAVVYEDCRRDLDLELGPEIIQVIGRPLGLFLSSGNFLIRRVAAIAQQKCNGIYDALVAETGERRVRGNQFWLRLEPELLGLTACIDSVLREFQQKWLELLRFSPTARVETYTAEQLAPRVQEAFGKSEAVWPASIYSSPDIMITAKDVEAINQGRYLAVLGEVHISGNTLGSTLFISQHPNPAEMVEARKQDIHPPVVFLSPPRHLPKLTTRTHVGLACPDDLEVDFSLNSAPIEGLRNILIGDLSICREADELIAETPASQLRLRVIDILEGFLAALVQPTFRMLPPLPHTPRLVCDRLVFARECWHFEPKELSFAFQREETARFMEARRWVTVNGIQRYAFVKVPNETKPFFVDLASVACVELLAKNVRRSREVSPNAPVRITEMLPAPEECWLTDHEGGCYTSEFRMVVVDRWLANAHHAGHATPSAGL